MYGILSEVVVNFIIDYGNKFFFITVKQKNWMIPTITMMSNDDDAINNVAMNNDDYHDY